MANMDNLLRFLAHFGGNSVQQNIANIDQTSEIGNGDGTLIKAEFDRAVKSNWGLIETNGWNGEANNTLNQRDLINQWWASMDVNNSNKKIGGTTYTEGNALGSGDIEKLNQKAGNFDFEDAREKTVAYDPELGSKIEAAIQEVNKYLQNSDYKAAIEEAFGKDIEGFLKGIKNPKVLEEFLAKFKEVIAAVDEKLAAELAALRETTIAKLNEIVDMGDKYEQSVKQVFGQNYADTVNNLSKVEINAKMQLLNAMIEQIKADEIEEANKRTDIKVSWPNDPTINYGKGDQFIKLASTASDNTKITYKMSTTSNTVGGSIEISGNQIVVSGASKAGTIVVQLRAYDENGNRIQDPHTMTIKVEKEVIKPEEYSVSGSVKFSDSTFYNNETYTGDINATVYKNHNSWNSENYEITYQCETPGVTINGTKVVANFATPGEKTIEIAVLVDGVEVDTIKITINVIQDLKDINEKDLQVDNNSIRYSDITKYGETLDTENAVKLIKDVKNQYEDVIKAQLEAAGFNFDGIKAIFENVFQQSINEYRYMYASSFSKQNVIKNFTTIFNKNMVDTIKEMNKNNDDMDFEDLDYSVLAGVFGTDKNPDGNQYDTYQKFLNGESISYTATNCELGGAYLPDERNDFKAKAKAMMEALKSQIKAKAKAACAANGVEFDENAFNTRFNNSIDAIITNNNYFPTSYDKTWLGTRHWTTTTYNPKQVVNAFLTEFETQYSKWINDQGGHYNSNSSSRANVNASSGTTNSTENTGSTNDKIVLLSDSDILLNLDELNLSELSFYNINVKYMESAPSPYPYIGTYLKSGEMKSALKDQFQKQMEANGLKYEDLSNEFEEAYTYALELTIQYAPRLNLGLVASEYVDYMVKAFNSKLLQLVHSKQESLRNN